MTVDQPYQRGLVVYGCDDLRVDKLSVLAPRNAPANAAVRVIGTPDASTRIHFSKPKITSSQVVGIDFTSVTTGSIKDGIVTGCTNEGILLFDSTGIEVSGNDSSSNQYGLTEGGTSDNNNIHDNEFISNSVQAVSGLVGASTTARNNRNFVTENYGAAASVADGGTISHGLAVTPVYAEATCSVAGEMASVTAISSTLLTIAIKKNDGTAGTTQTIYWRAKKY